MKLKNYQEDLVLHLVEIVLENHPDIEVDEDFIHDVAAYTLNRIPPQYIMSERGFTRFALHNLASQGNGDGLVNLVEVLIVINKAIGVVQSRRRSPQVALVEDSSDYHISRRTVSGTGVRIDTETDTVLPEEDIIYYVHNFPQFIGRVMVQQTLEPVYNACVTLNINGEKVLPAEPGWLNPYYTNEPTKGYFSFWPRPLKSTTETETFAITVVVEHPDYRTERLEHTMTIEGMHTVHNYIEGDAVVDLEILYLTTPNSA